MPGLPPLYGGLNFLPNDPNTLILGGHANTESGYLYTIGVVRDNAGHITGFSGEANRFAEGAYNDGGIVYGPGGVLFLARWPVNELGQTKPGSVITDKIINLAQLNVCSALAALNFVPPGFPGAGQFKLVTYSGGCWYTAGLQADNQSTYDITSVVQETTIIGGPEGFIYVPPGSAHFPDYNSLLVAEYSAGNIAAYELDGNGDPAPDTRKVFISGLSGAEGTAFDPRTGDFLFSTFGGGNRVVVVRGFAVPPTPGPTATPTATSAVGEPPTATPTQPGEQPTATPTQPQPPTATPTLPAPPTATPTLPAPTATRTLPAPPTATHTQTPVAPDRRGTLNISSRSTLVGGEGFIDLDVDIPPPGLSSWTIDVQFNPDVAAAVACDAFAGSVCGVLGPDGDTVRVAGSGASGPSGDPVSSAGAAPGVQGHVLLASIRFVCIAPGATSLRALPVLLLDATPGSPQPLAVEEAEGALSCVAATATTVPPLPTNTSVAVVAGSQAATPTEPAAPTPAVSPEPTRASNVLGDTNPTPAGPGGDGGGQTRSSTLSGALEARPESSGAVPTPGQLSTSAAVIVTNIMLALILLLVLLVSSAIFNGTVDENRKEIDGVLRRLTGPFQGMGAAINRAAGSGGSGPSWLAALLAPLAVLLLTGLVYSLNEPDWGLNKKSLVLFLSLVIALGIITYIYEGGEALLQRARFRLAAGVKLVPFALAIAVGFVVLSRSVHFQIPIMYGFIAASTLLVPAQLDRRQSALGVLIPAAVLLALSLGAWALVGPLRDASANSDHWFSVLPGEVAALLFAGSVEGLLFVMIPLKFLDGAKIWAWNRLLWALAFAIPAFLFSWVILNPAAQEFDVLLKGRVVTALCMVGVYASTTALFWGYFHILHLRGAQAAHS